MSLCYSDDLIEDLLVECDLRMLCCEVLADLISTLPRLAFPCTAVLAIVKLHHVKTDSPR